jgi:excinuclease ABC subunit B
MQYTRNDVNFSRGTFRVRGGVIDIFPADEGANAVRVVLFGDDIEEIKIIDALTSNTIEKVDEFVIYPKTHYATPKERLDEIQEIIERDLELRLRELKNSGKILEASRLEQRTKYDLEMINEVGYCSGIENYSRYLSGRDPGAPPPTLFDYFPDRSLLFLDESHIMLPQINAMFHGDRSRKNNLVEYGFRLPSALDNRPLSFEEFEDMKPQTIYVSATPGEYELSNSSTVAEQIIRPTGILDPKIEIRSALTQVDDVLHEIRQATKNNNRVLITTLTKKMSENLSEFLKENNVLVKYLHSDIDTMERVEILRDLREGTIDVLVGINLLREGLDLPEVSLVAIFDADQTGFLRSKRSLIQTIGRAARNPNGRVIMYSEQMTPAMEEAISETNRRREIQEKYNKQHNITPKAINKSLINIVGGTEQKKANKTLSNPRSSPNEIKQLIKNKHNKMLEYAKELKFEEASKYRDEIKALKEELLKS